MELPGHPFIFWPFLPMLQTEQPILHDLPGFVIYIMAYLLTWPLMSGHNNHTCNWWINVGVKWSIVVLHDVFHLATGRRGGGRGSKWQDFKRWTPSYSSQEEMSNKWQSVNALFVTTPWSIQGFNIRDDYLMYPCFNETNYSNHGNFKILQIFQAFPTHTAPPLSSMSPMTSFDPAIRGTA